MQNYLKYHTLYKKMSETLTNWDLVFHILFSKWVYLQSFLVTGSIIIIIMAGMAVFYVAVYLIEERRRWPVITASPRVTYITDNRFACQQI